LVNTGEALNEHCDVVGMVAFTLYATPAAVAFSPEPSTRGVVNITQDVRLELQLLQSMLDYIADADDTD
jgi:hypothetical protein